MKEFVLDLSEMFDRAVAARAKVWKHDRSKSLGASEVFGCLRQNWFKKNSSEKDTGFSDRWGAMERGNIMEDHHVAPAFENFLPEPLGVLYAGQKNQRTLVVGTLSGTPDGLITGLPRGNLRLKCVDRADIVIEIGDEGCMGLEIKSIDPRANLHEERTKHHGQSQVGLGLIREATKWKPNYWLILYVDASFYDDMKPFVVKYDNDIYEAAKRRANLVFAADEATALPAEGKYNNECDHCPYVDSCREAIFSQWHVLENAERTDDAAALAIAPLVEKFLHAKSDAADANTLVDELKEELKSRMAELSTKKVVGENWKATWSTRAGSKRLDKAGMRADGINVGEYEVQGKPYDTLLVTIQE
jgi:hypothetical protein